MTTESCTTTSLMTTRHQRALCPSLKNYNNEHLPFDHWEVRSSIAPEWTRQARMELCFAMNGLYFCFMLDRCLYFSISALRLMQRLRMNVGIRLCNESYTGLCHNVTQVVTWPITSYGGAGGKSPSRAPINRFGKKNSFQNWNWKTHQMI